MYVIHCGCVCSITALLMQTCPCIGSDSKCHDFLLHEMATRSVKHPSSNLLALLWFNLNRLPQYEPSQYPLSYQMFTLCVRAVQVSNEATGATDEQDSTEDVLLKSDIKLIRRLLAGNKLTKPFSETSIFYNDQVLS